MRQLPLLQCLVRLGCVGMLLSASTAWPQAQPGVGRVTALEGEATVLHRERFAPQPLTLQSTVFQGDIIETGGASKIRITLTDATTISLGERSRLALRQLEPDDHGQIRTARLAVSMGIFRAIVNKFLPSSTYEVRTPTAIAAIRGTDLMGEVTADSTAIVALEGTVAISHVRTRVSGVAILTEGEGTTVTADQPPTTPTKWSESRVEALRQATTVR